MPIARILAFLGLALGLVGCSLAPAYQRPLPPTPAAVDPKDPVPSELALPTLGIFFQEPRLKSLIATALTENRDLRLAALNVEAARVSLGLAQADRYPNLELSGTKTVAGGPERPTTRSYDLGLMTVFEADFFGRLKNLSEAAFQRYLGAAEAARAARLSLIGQVAAAYLETRLSAEELDLANRTLNNWRSYLAFMENRLVAGQSQLLDLEMARSQVARAEASLAAAETVLSQAENNLALLVGSWAAKDRPDPWALAKWPRPNLPANVASTALLKRPDILEAERNLMASHADIGAARAAFFPSLSLTGELGYMSGQLDTLVASNSAGWSFVPRLTLPIFAGGRNVRNLELAWVRRSQAVAAYEKTIQVAFTEVALTLAARPKLAQEVAAQTNYLKAQRRVVELAANRYQGGAASYLDVLAAQRDFYEAEMAALRARRAEILNDIQLYLALGGGVEDDFSLNPAGGN